MAQSTVFRYKGRPSDAQMVGRELNVHAVVAGRVIQRGETLLIAAELVDAATGSQLWGAQYNRKLQDIFAIQDEIAKEISEKLRLRLTGAAKKRLTKRYTEKSEAYQLYLRGRYHWIKWTQEGFTKGIEYFDQAAQKDSGYALAYSGLADCYALLVWNCYLAPGEGMPKMKAAAARALQLDDALAEAHNSLAAAKWGADWDWPGAEREFKRSITLNPNNSTAYHWYAEYLKTMGRHDEAIAAVQRAQELEPFVPIINVGVGWAFHYARRVDEAIERSESALELDPNFAVAHWVLGLAYKQKGRYQEAISEGERSVTLPGGRSAMHLASLGHTYAMAGKRDEACGVLDELTSMAKDQYVSPHLFAQVHAGLGEKDEALAWLGRTYEERSLWLLYLNIEPTLDPLRSEPRFQELVRRVGLPQ